MSNLPKFTPSHGPTPDAATDLQSVDYRYPPRCAACDDVCWSRDASTLTCRRCWRVIVLLPFVLNVTPKDGGAPVTDIESVRVPRLTETAGPAGVALDVELAKPPRKR